jgi:FSR family fosmidomycin resistance protein-like MFS transporter
MTDHGLQATARPPRTLPLALGVVHGVVDATTIWVLFRGHAIFHTPRDDFFRLIIAYDLLAFAVQPALGWALDRLGRLRDGALAGLGLCFAAVLLLPLNAAAAVVVGALGNAVFHVGAGGLAIRAAVGRSAPLGLFVAPGALGVAVGAWAAQTPIVEAWIVAAYLAGSMVAVWAVASGGAGALPPPPAKPPVEKPAALAALLLVSIAVRSLIGRAGGYEMPTTAMTAFAVAAAAFAGKANGGVWSDRFGWLATSVGALLISAPLLAFGGDNAVAIIVGLFIFQMTMPVTLAATAALVPGRPAYAFGLASLAYILGALPTYFKAVSVCYNPVIFLALILVSIAALVAGLRPLRRLVLMKFDDGQA